MMFAKSETGSRIEAFPGSAATCPGCNQRLIPKCGQIKIWHWSHVADECDSWHEPESEWHLNWKKVAWPDQCEVVMGPHRADIVGIDGRVIELQHSSISPVEIAEREQFYKRMIWLVDAEPFGERLRFKQKAGRIFGFDWMHLRKHHAFFEAPLFWDCSALVPMWQRELEKQKQETADHWDAIYKNHDIHLIDVLHGYRANSEHQEQQISRILEYGPIFRVNELNADARGGWGTWMSREAFISEWIRPRGAQGELLR